MNILLYDVYQIKKSSLDFISRYPRSYPFRSYEKLITELFKNTVKAARDLGVIGLEQLSTDGSMKKASASKNNVVLEEVLIVIGEYVNNELKRY